MSTDDTPADRRQALLARREQLYAQQARRMAQKQQAEDEASFQRYLGAELTSAGVRFELRWADDAPRGPMARYPIGFASVHWGRVPHAVSVQGGSDDERKDLLDAALCALGIGSSTRVTVDWCRSGLPRVVLSAADASAHALALMQHASDMWVYAQDAPWLIEIYHEGSVTYADRPGRPEDAGDGWRRFE